MEPKQPSTGSTSLPPLFKQNQNYVILYYNYQPPVKFVIQLVILSLNEVLPHVILNLNAVLPLVILSLNVVKEKNLGGGIAGVGWSRMIRPWSPKATPVEHQLQRCLEQMLQATMFS